MIKKILFFVNLMFISFVGNTQPKSAKPNIIFILADDLGYRDLGAYAKKLQVYQLNPNITKHPILIKWLKRVQLFLKPTLIHYVRQQASLLTGKYASRLGFMTATAGSVSTP